MGKRATKILPFVTRLRHNERGVQLVEVAIVMPILLVLLAAAAEFGRYFYVYSTLSRATRTAVRHISSKEFSAAKKTEAINLALCGSTTACGSGTEILSGLTADNFTITTSGGTADFPTTVTVQVAGYNYTPIFNLGNFADGVSWTSVPVNAKTTMRYMNSN
ncbi:MAG TPA: TadE/TadG family type IV pilus assembly protein [Blastocatellia bacterium]|nr:TadE/TadG family type IV pilus assembly protein [Blastocatellia bacterium]